MNRWILIIAALTLFSVTSLSIAVNSSEIERQLEQCYRKGGTCIDDLESAILARPESKATHSGNILSIRTRSKVVSFKDRPNAEEQTILNTYLGFLDGIGYHLVDRRLWEGNDFVLVSDLSGEQFPMSAIPHASPSAKRVVSVSASEAYNPNEIVVWLVTPERLTREFHYSPEEYALYKFLSWDGETTIRLEKFTRSKKENCPNSQFMTVSEVLQFSQGKWQFSGETPAKVKCQ
jgi:hypothetical protein